MRYLFNTFLFLSMLGSYAQVGIGTTNPQETLHVVGSVRVESSPSITDPVGLVGADDEGTLTTINIQNTLTLTNGKVNVQGNVLYGIGSQNLSGITYDGNFIHDLELGLGPGEPNEGMSVVKVYNLPANGKLTGIQDGVDGLHLFFYNVDTGNIQFMDESDTDSAGSQPENRIKVLAGSETISGRGCVELLYDGTAQRWLFLSIHD